MLKIERFEVLYSQGTAERIEDGLITNPPFFGVIDGLSAPYHYKMEPIRFDGMSGGEMVRKVVLETFSAANPSLPLEEVSLQANQKIKEFQVARGIPIERSDLLAGACFAFAKLGIRTFELIQGGDCFGVWVYKNGEIGVTKNQAYLHVSENLRIIAEIMRRVNWNRNEMWVEFFPILSKFRLRDINQKTRTGYALLNGQSTIKKCWQKITIPVAGLEFLILFTDGLIWYPESVDEKKMVEKVVSAYEKWGLRGVLNEKRRTEKKNAKTLYIDRDEATAIAIEFGV